MAIGSGLLKAQEKPLKSNQKMEKKSTTLRLIYPQWQGGIITHYFPDLPADDASRGYYLGAHLLNFLAPDNGQKTIEVPVSLDPNDRATENGVSARNIIIKQSKAALDLLNDNKPERIITLGGDCAVSVVPFTYLAAKYPGDVAIVWIDAHPDLTLPYDGYEGYHAMALAACFGRGDEEIIKILPGKVEPPKAILIGLRDEDKKIQARQKEWGVMGLTPAEVADNSSALMEWLKNTGASKVVIHFDLDVLEPTEMRAAVGNDPNGMRIAEVLRVINDIAAEYDVVGLTVAEPLPQIAIKIKNMLSGLPLLDE